jgi:hypothetical protein
MLTSFRQGKPTADGSTNHYQSLLLRSNTMTGRQAPPEHNWWIGLRDGSRFTVRAAYVQQGMSANAEIGAPIVLKDADHKVVLIAPPDWVGYVERESHSSTTLPSAAYVPLPAGTNLTPGQMRDLQDALDDAAKGLGWSTRILILPPGGRASGDSPPDDALVPA